MSGKILITTVCLSLLLLASVFLETKLVNYVPAELVLLIIGVGLTAAVYIGLYKNESWAWPSAVVLTMLLLANMIFLFAQTRAIWTFVISLVLGVIGGASAILALNGTEQKSEELHYTPMPEVPLETYTPSRGRGRPKKA